MCLKIRILGEGIQPFAPKNTCVLKDRATARIFSKRMCLKIGEFGEAIKVFAPKNTCVLKAEAYAKDSQNACV
ncbi:hypothetical protein COV06_03735 [Candidatus Uhrbacteria bacterium CG10_big_fil_rev_8_21_14_0_10_50_16]|uniref:Uncharacterized protein n=1 Tax=Candidatus Uhrbacteria bacterium CG10_big_fil_rev_8_21_14_0_10_50_16 TaxID=1975039 RepID=A0A2H0RLR1_9BACT|nr:MAG: hypothetical protein COV06_03735 [Candidatus Uhrbacteria bacterium CG10_big_fil_rev_8_21_14_0_10_50_16]